MRVTWEHTRRLEFDGTDEEFARDIFEEHWSISDVDGCNGEEGVRLADEDWSDHVEII